MGRTASSGSLACVDTRAANPFGDCTERRCDRRRAMDNLVRSGIFDQVGFSDFSDLLQALGAHDLITQDHGGSLLPGVLGEKLINQFDFYSAFSTGEEFRLTAEGRVLGSLPIERPLTSGQRIIFGGRRWKVLDIDTQGKAVYVVRDRGGAPPSFDGIGGVVHDRVRQEMKQVLTEVRPISFLDSKAAELLEEARQWFKAAGVGAQRWSVDGHSTLLFGWHGDTVQDALALLLTAKARPAAPRKRCRWLCTAKGRKRRLRS
jgi:ATP-dependent Lhr-like helicase